MQPEKLSEKAKKIAQEAKNHFEAISKFGPEFKKSTIEAIRLSALKEVDQIYIKVLQEVAEEYIDLQLFPRLYSDNEVWVYASPVGNRGLVLISISKMKRETANEVAATMRKNGAIYLPDEIFTKLIMELKASILEGKQDEHIHLKGEQLIYNKMCTVSFPPKLKLTLTKSEPNDDINT